MATRIAHTACPLDCPDICDLDASVDEATGRLVAVEGGRRGPVTDGFVCTKVRNIARYVYAPDRVPHPLIRVGRKRPGRGDGDGFRRASWDEALDLVADRIRGIRARAGGEAI